MTLGVTLSITAYALTTKSDFTMAGGTLFIISAAFMLFGIIAIFFGGMTPIVNLIYSTIGVILYGFYLIYDIQLLVGDHKQEYSMDDYIVASI